MNRAALSRATWIDASSTKHSVCSRFGMVSMMKLSHQRMTRRSEPSEQRMREPFLASRRIMPSPPSRAISALTTFPSTQDVLCSAGKARRASR